MKSKVHSNQPRVESAHKANIKPGFLGKAPEGNRDKPSDPMLSASSANASLSTQKGQR